MNAASIWAATFEPSPAQPDSTKQHNIVRCPQAAVPFIRLRKRTCAALPCCRRSTPGQQLVSALRVVQLPWTAEATAEAMLNAPSKDSVHIASRGITAARKEGKKDEKTAAVVGAVPGAESLEAAHEAAVLCPAA